MRPPPIKPTQLIVNLMVTMATGFLPWGVDWRHKVDDGSLQVGIDFHKGHGWILCCEHVYRTPTMMTLVRRGLLTRGVPREGVLQLVATERGRRWAWRHRDKAEGVGEVAFAMAGGATEMPLSAHGRYAEFHAAMERGRRGETVTA